MANKVHSMQGSSGDGGDLGETVQLENTQNRIR